MVVQDTRSCGQWSRAKSVCMVNVNLGWLQIDRVLRGPTNPLFQLHACFVCDKAYRSRPNWISRIILGSLSRNVKHQNLPTAEVGRPIVDVVTKLWSIEAQTSLMIPREHVLIFTPANRWVQTNEWAATLYVFNTTLDWPYAKVTNTVKIIPKED